MAKKAKKAADVGGVGIYIDGTAARKKDVDAVSRAVLEVLAMCDYARVDNETTRKALDVLGAGVQSGETVVSGCTIQGPM